MTEGVFKSPLLDRRPFVPARYAELRTEAVAALGNLVAAFYSGDPSLVAAAVLKSEKVLGDIDALWHGKAVP